MPLKLLPMVVKMEINPMALLLVLLLVVSMKKLGYGNAMVCPRVHVETTTLVVPDRTLSTWTGLELVVAIPVDLSVLVVVMAGKALVRALVLAMDIKLMLLRSLSFILKVCTTKASLDLPLLQPLALGRWLRTQCNVLVHLNGLQKLKCALHSHQLNSKVVSTTQALLAQ
jgi:hypothetical protein